MHSLSKKLGFDINLGYHNNGRLQPVAWPHPYIHHWGHCSINVSCPMHVQEMLLL